VQTFSAFFAFKNQKVYFLGREREGGLKLLGHHHLNELLVVDLSITVDVCFPDHFVALFVRQLLTKVGHDMAQLCAKIVSLNLSRNNQQRNSPAALIKPLPSLSKTLKASMISSSLSVSFILRAIIVRNSGKSMVPLPSASTSLIMSWSSASVGFCPSERMTVPSSLVVIVPSPSLSNKENASLNSAICQIRSINYMSAKRTPIHLKTEETKKALELLGRQPVIPGNNVVCAPEMNGAPSHHLYKPHAQRRSTLRLEIDEMHLAASRVSLRLDTVRARGTPRTLVHTFGASSLAQGRLWPPLDKENGSQQPSSLPRAAAHPVTHLLFREGVRHGICCLLCCLCFAPTCSGWSIQFCFRTALLCSATRAPSPDG